MAFLFEHYEKDTADLFIRESKENGIKQMQYNPKIHKFRIGSNVINQISI